MKSKRGQVALEFLMTYGWAILIITLIAVILWQMDIFNPGGKIEPGLTGFWGIVPAGNDFSYLSDGTITLALSNKVGATVEIEEITVTVKGSEYADSDPELDFPLNNPLPDQNITAGGTGIWQVALAGAPWDATNVEMPAGSQFRIFVSIQYIDSRTGESYLSSGWIWGNVE